MSQPYKICPICRAPSHRNAAYCSNCGASLSDVPAVDDHETPGNQETPSGKARNGVHSRYDARYGETDLFEGELRRKGEVYFLGITITLAVLICGGLLVGLGPRVFSALSALSQPEVVDTPTPSGPTAVPTSGGANASSSEPTVQLATNTPRPTLNLATVTPAPPTEAPTETPAPCLRTVASGDDLLSIAYTCGHRHLDIVAVIVATNSLDSPESLQIGQELVIPWPTPTVDPNMLPTLEPTEADNRANLLDDDGNTLVPAEIALRNASAMGTATLQAGVQYHRVQANENIMNIAFSYGANIEILSQLNPEVTFSQCDFGSPTGGPNCIVPIYAGQLIRVPAPTPTPTLPPTPTGSETPTPSPSPTVNAPSVTGPGDRTPFDRDELITLRWVTTGTLSEDEAYRVTVQDTTAGVVYTADTTELFFIVPEAWQGIDSRRHEYTWTVGIIDKNQPESQRDTTPPRMFSWQGRGATT